MLRQTNVKLRSNGRASHTIVEWLTQPSAGTYLGKGFLKDSVPGDRDLDVLWQSIRLRGRKTHCQPPSEVTVHM